MSWIVILLLGLATFLVAAFLLRLPKSGWAMFGSALLFGLAGYTLQGSPDLAAAPKANIPVIDRDNFAMIEARREFFDPESVPSRFVTVADGFARQGQYDDAANMLGNAVSENPRDVEAWVALGNSLIEHSEGISTPAALYAYARAERLEPENPASAYFLGIAYLRSGRPDRTRALWMDLLASAPQDAPWREGLQARIERLDQLLEQMGS